jgi:DNA-binding MarR family transcriptional regulator
MCGRNVEMLAAHDLELWEWDILSALWRTGELEITMGAIAAQTFTTAGSATNRAGRLEMRELVERRQAPP